MLIRRASRRPVACLTGVALAGLFMMKVAWFMFLMVCKMN